MDEPATELALLLDPTGRRGEPYLVSIPTGATRHDTGHDGVPIDIRDMTFVRTEVIDDDFQMPLFRRHTRQL